LSAGSIGRKTHGGRVEHGQSAYPRIAYAFDVYQESPHREEYRLTASGRELSRVTQALLDWGDRWAVTASPVRLVHHHDHQLHTATVCTVC
jgi:hypothetical protein